MIYGRNYDMERESMPQTVPSAGQSPPSSQYTFTADSFDLSLLPPDGEVPVSPPSLRHLVTLLGDPTTEPMFGARDEEDCIKHKTQETDLGDFDFPTTILEDNIPQLKSMPAFKTESQRLNQYQNDSNTLLFEQFHNFGYQSPVYPTPSPSSDEGSIPTFSIQPCSPYDTSNLSYSSPNSYSPYLTVKQEPNILLSPQYSGNSPYPHSPASTCASYSNHSSPHYIQPVSPSQFTSTAIKDEAAIDIEEFLKENQILQDSVYSQQKLQSENQVQTNYETLLVPKIEPYAKPKDHQLLREVLQDTTFQKRFNLRPLNLDSLTSGFSPFTNLSVKMEEPDGLSSASDTLMTSCSSVLAREKIEPVLSLAIEQMRKDVDNTCLALGISPDPVQWSGEDVKAWLLWTLRQYSLPLVPMEYFCMDGAKLAALSEQDFVQRAPQAGSTLFAQLEIWKAARQESGAGGAGGSWCATPSVATLSSTEEASDDEDEEMTPAGNGTQSPPSSSTAGKTPAKGGSHIHLWQFLKELLASPQLHGSAIRWLDRGKGVFKIEDSVRVARLWGKRKNRPAMNYDKLSRSIRQYYKKGIMKKTERSQRLVYQFCHPYCL